MKFIGIIDDNDSFESYAFIYKFLENFYKLEFISSYKNILKNSSFSSITEYITHLSNEGVDVIIFRLHSADLYAKELSQIKFNVLLLANIKHFLDMSSSKPTYLLYNYDLYHDFDFIKNYSDLKYSYGLSYNADIFPSSLQDDGIIHTIMICINRNLITLSNNCIVSQEFSLKMNNLDESKIYNILASFIIFILLDIKVSTILNSIEMINKEERIHV